MKKAGSELPRPYRCPICDKAFYRLEHQTRHIRTHTGEKPHVCTYPGCTKRFSRSDELTRHSRIHTNPNSRRNLRKELNTSPVNATGSASQPASNGSVTSSSSSSKTPHASPPQPHQPLMFSAPTSPHGPHPGSVPHGAPPHGAPLGAPMAHGAAASSHASTPIAQGIPPPVAPPQPMARAASSVNLMPLTAASRWTQSSQSQYDIHALANTATQVLEQERRQPHFNRQRSTPALASYFHQQHAHSSPYDRRGGGHQPNEHLVPQSPAVSRPASPSPDSTPLATPGHSPHFGPQECVQLPAIRTLPLSRFGQNSHPHPYPMEPAPQPFSAIRGTLDLPTFSLSSQPSTPLMQSPAVSRASSPPPVQRPPRVAVSDLVNPVKIEN